MATFVATPASAEETATDGTVTVHDSTSALTDAQEIATLADELTPAELLTEPQVPGTRGTDLIVEAATGHEIIVPTLASEAVAIPNGQSSVEIGLPQPSELEPAVIADDGAVVYESFDIGADVTLQVYDDVSVRIRTVIPDRSSPDRYVFAARPVLLSLRQSDLDSLQGNLESRSLASSHQLRVPDARHVQQLTGFAK